jgi:hypothetical protein
MSYPIIHIPT